LGGEGRVKWTRRWPINLDWKVGWSRPDHDTQGVAEGKMPIAAAAEVHDGGPGRVRLAAIADFSAASLTAFIVANITADTVAKTDG
jgi:hypothetical protein